MCTFSGPALFLYKRGHMGGVQWSIAVRIERKKTSPLPPPPRYRGKAIATLSLGIAPARLALVVVLPRNTRSSRAKIRPEKLESHRRDTVANLAQSGTLVNRFLKFDAKHHLPYQPHRLAVQHFIFLEETLCFTNAKRLK